MLGISWGVHDHGHDRELLPVLCCSVGTSDTETSLPLRCGQKRLSFGHVIRPEKAATCREAPCFTDLAVGWPPATAPSGGPWAEPAALCSDRLPFSTRLAVLLSFPASSSLRTGAPWG